MMVKKMLIVMMSGLFAVLIYSGQARAHNSGFSGSFLVQASGTAYFPYIGSYPTGVSPNVQQVLHFTMAGSATFNKGTNTAVNLTLNLGGVSSYEDSTSFWAASGNDVICHFVTAGDLTYNAPSGTTPAMLIVSPGAYNANDYCAQPSGFGAGPTYVVGEWGKVIPFNYYPSSLMGTAGLIISNYSCATAGGPCPSGYANGFTDSFGDTAIDFSATGQVTPTTPNFSFVP
jgi:hypothetical protein